MPLHLTPVLLGVGGALGARAAAQRGLLALTRAAIARSNRGDTRLVTSLYADDAVIRLADGPHRWAGEHHGRIPIARFLREFSDAGIVGTVHRLWFSGPPWALRIVVDLGEHVAGADGATVYRNETAVVLRTRWGRIVEHTDLFFDTSRLTEFEARLREQPGIARTRTSPAG